MGIAGKAAMSFCSPKTGDTVKKWKRNKAAATANTRLSITSLSCSATR